MHKFKMTENYKNFDLYKRGRDSLGVSLC